jgi:hypothetical protein
VDNSAMINVSGIPSNIESAKRYAIEAAGLMRCVGCTGS